MRLHHLRIQAFGPFGDIVEVDFDELNSAGQFLISGATGSGKTSILDAVCFALYGEVPGERQRAKHLRSDHAAEGVEPRVTLTLTIADRLVRISRSPAWERPKRRGAGVTTQQPSVRVEQFLDGSWVCLATRLDEAGQLIGTWLGMTRVQFTQVALLPQGGFQTFLHAPSATRQVILQRLFRTDRFERVEKWFAEFRRSINRQCVEAIHALDVLAHRLAEAAGVDELPHPEAHTDSLERWVHDLNQTVAAQRATAEHRLVAATQAHTTAVRELDVGLVLASTRDRAVQAAHELALLDSTAGSFATELAALEAHRSASTLRPLINTHRAARDNAVQAQRRAQKALSFLGDAAEIEERTTAARDDLERATRAVELAERIQHTEVLHLDLDERWRTQSTAVAELRTTSHALPHELQRIAVEVQQAQLAHHEAEAASSAVAAATAGRSAAVDYEQVCIELAALEETQREDRNHVLNLKQVYLEAREARIDAMASELAEALVVGCSCPVCGSTAHPAPARVAGSTGRKAEERARRAYESAETHLRALEEMISGTKARQSALRAGAGGRSVEEWATLQAEREAHDEAVKARVGRLAALQGAEQNLAQELAEVRGSLEEAVRLEGELAAQLDLSTTELLRLRALLDDALGEHEDAVAYAEKARRCVARLDAARAAVEELRESERLATHHREALTAEAAHMGFSSAAEAEAAILEDDRAASITLLHDERTQRRVSAQTVLEDPQVKEVMELSPPCLEHLRAQTTYAEQILADAQASARLATQRATRTASIATDLVRAIEHYRPLETKSQQVIALSGLLEGTGANNRLRMRLSAFVLAERLRQVIDAANARLSIISEGRYVLHYQEQRGAGENRGGLSLSVLDEWTGVRRDPTTLSGGETFVVSLCLALGLADTVADESGGLRIDTLFVDEGFGSLDAQTLDLVIDILGQLSQGGRVTGIVSHVPELRERLPAVLEVVRGKAGSTLRKATA